MNDEVQKLERRARIAGRLIPYMRVAATEFAKYGMANDAGSVNMILAEVLGLAMIELLIEAED